MFFDIKDTIDKKIEAMRLYESELREYPHPRSLRFIKELAKTNGIKVGLNYSENFMLIRNVNEYILTLTPSSSSVYLKNSKEL